ncbi:unnamed protein product [Rotaria sp. Silwood2]|nr:unnamed protein product [Rotaria sp. Silwood2]
MFLTSLYALRQYFRQPPKEEAYRRQQLEVKFLILIQQYIFPPAMMALVHALQSKMFAFEKTILSDALLHLLREFCPEDIEQTLLGTFMPNLICWLFEQCIDIDSKVLPCTTYDLGRCIKDEENYHIDDSATKVSPDEDSKIVFQQRAQEQQQANELHQETVYVVYIKEIGELSVKLN